MKIANCVRNMFLPSKSLVWLGASDSLHGSYDSLDGSSMTLEQFTWNIGANFYKCPVINIYLSWIDTEDCSDGETEAICQIPSGKILITLQFPNHPKD